MSGGDWLLGIYKANRLKSFPRERGRLGDSGGHRGGSLSHVSGGDWLKKQLHKTIRSSFPRERGEIGLRTLSGQSSVFPK